MVLARLSNMCLSRNEAVFAGYSQTVKYSSIFMVVCTWCVVVYTPPHANEHNHEQTTTTSSSPKLSFNNQSFRQPAPVAAVAEAGRAAPADSLAGG